MISRRNILKAAGAGLAAPWARFARAETSADGFTILRAAPAKAALLEGGALADVWTYGDWPAPVLRAKQGQAFKTRFINTLDRPISVHWFGVRGPSEMMSLSIEPGEANAIDCVFTPPDAGTFWFGPVADASRQREMGLYGALIVEEATAPVAPYTEHVLLLDDWKLTDSGLIDVESFGNLEEAIAQGRLGNWFTVNGAYRPFFKGPARGLVRLRLVNVANVRTMSLQFKGTDPWIIARDGQPIVAQHIGEAPLELEPGQRADLLVEPGDEMISIALDLFEDVVELAYIDREGGDGQAMPPGFALPSNPLPALGDLAAARRVELLLEGGEKGGLKAATLEGVSLDVRALLEKGFAWAINGVAGLGSAPWQAFAKGETVVISVKNQTAFAQPICIHGHVWQAAGGAGWTDTAVIPAKSSAELVFVADNPGNWGLHSTIAERMDSGLITSFTVS
jgi:FtsP/CotA-like multicopper oxidase with cupredoxin domain